MSNALRVDVLLHRLRLTRSRSEAKAACEAGAVHVDGQPARASQAVVPGQQVSLHFPDRLLTVVPLKVPAKSLSKQQVRVLYRVVGDEPAPDER